MCNKCNQPIECSCKRKPSLLKDISTDDVVYDGLGMPCISVETNTPLTQTLEAIDDAICEIKGNGGGSSSALINVGTGTVVYAGDNNIGQKQIKSITVDESLNITSTSTQINLAVDEDWVRDLVVITTDQNIVMFNTANPNTGSPTFTPNTPQNIDIIYTSSVNNSLWVWNGTTYVTYTPPSTTPFFLKNTNLDAGGNKNVAIGRLGAIGIGTVDPQATLHVVGAIRQGALNGILKADNQGTLTLAVAGVEYLAPTGSAAELTSFPILNQNTTGNAATVTTNANLTGDVTSVGNVTTLSNTAVTAGTYVSSNITVDAKGRITAATSGGGARAIVDRYIDAANTGSTQTSLFQLPIPANTAVTNGDKFEFNFAGALQAPGVTKALTFAFGSQSFQFSTTNNGSFTLKGIMVRTAVDMVKVAMNFQAGSYVNNYVATFSGGINFTTIMPITLLGTASASNQITASLGTLVFIPAAI